eukprot:scaffold16319_cov77-Phaeocystis_antarctica.AAC.2
MGSKRSSPVFGGGQRQRRGTARLGRRKRFVDDAAGSTRPRPRGFKWWPPPLHLPLPAPSRGSASKTQETPFLVS